MPAPNPSHNVRGKVILSGTNQPVNGATVTITDSTLGESLPATLTIANGEYMGNLSELDSAFSQGDTLSVTATYGNRSKTGTATISGGGTVINLTLDITSYPDYTLDTKQAVNINAKDIMDVDKTYTRNSNRQPIKIVENYGKFTVTKYITYVNNVATNESWVVT